MLSVLSLSDFLQAAISPHPQYPLPSTIALLSPISLFSANTPLTCHFRASLKHKDDGQTKFIKPNFTKTRYNNQVLGKYRVDPQRAGLTLIAELACSNLGLKGVLNKRK